MLKYKFFNSNWTNKENNNSNIYFRGNAFREDSCDLITQDDLLTTDYPFKALNGFFSYVSMSNNKVIAAVDKTRSMPIFFSFIESSKTLYISDNANWIRDKLNDFQSDNVANISFLNSGYVIGNNTLHEKIKQLGPGEYLEFSGNKLNISKYYRFQATDRQVVNGLEDEYKSILSHIICRLIKYANGRQIVIPLSSGTDSRLILSLLKEKKYDNVLCFTYGMKNNVESSLSQIIAKSLGYSWHFIEYNEEKWIELKNNSTYKEYLKFSANLSSLPHLQDILAINELKINNVIDDDSVIVPGHCCVTSYIKKEFTKIPYNKEKITSEIIENHFNNSGSTLKDLDTIKNYIYKFIGDDEIKDIESFCSVIMEFNWFERQSKYITNSIRAYEFFDYDWWLPLWDDEMIVFFESFPLKYRFDRVWYKNVVSKIYAENSSQIINEIPKNNKYFRRVLRNIIPKRLIKLIIKRKKSKALRSHPLGFQYLIPKEDFMLLEKEGYNIIGMYSYLFLQGRL